jgi:hypothetical protein
MNKKDSLLEETFSEKRNKTKKESDKKRKKK